MLRDDINNALKEAMKARNERAVSTLRMVNSTIKNADIEARGAGQGPARRRRAPVGAAEDDQAAPGVGRALRQGRPARARRAGARGDRDHLRLSAQADVGRRHEGGDHRGHQGDRRRRHEGHGQGDRRAQGQACRQDGLRQGERPGEGACSISRSRDASPARSEDDHEKSRDTLASCRSRWPSRPSSRSHAVAQAQDYPTRTIRVLTTTGRRRHQRHLHARGRRRAARSAGASRWWSRTGRAACRMSACAPARTRRPTATPSASSMPIR